MESQRNKDRKQDSGESPHFMCSRFVQEWWRWTAPGNEAVREKLKGCSPAGACHAIEKERTEETNIFLMFFFLNQWMHANVSSMIIGHARLQALILVLFILIYSMCITVLANAAREGVVCFCFCSRKERQSGRTKRCKTLRQKVDCVW